MESDDLTGPGGIVDGEDPDGKEAKEAASREEAGSQ
jgi:hypothetical protein